MRRIKILFIIFSLMSTSYVFSVEKKDLSIKINEVDAVTLAQSVKGFGPKRADAIVKYRQENGAFKTLADLR